MSKMQLPIDIIKDGRGRRFKWTQVVHTPNDSRTVEHEGNLPVTIEVALETLINMTKRLVADNESLLVENERLKEKVEASSTKVPAAQKK